MRVFGLLQLVDSGFHQSRYAERSRQRLDLAILSFFQSFRKVYVGEQVMHSSKVSCLLRSFHSDVAASCQLYFASMDVIPTATYVAACKCMCTVCLFKYQPLHL